MAYPARNLEALEIFWRERLQESRLYLIAKVACAAVAGERPDVPMADGHFALPPTHSLGMHDHHTPDDHTVKCVRKHCPNVCEPYPELRPRAASRSNHGTNLCIWRLKQGLSRASDGCWQVHEPTVVLPPVRVAI